MTAQSNNTPWHLWVIGVVGLIWSSGGAFDYFMTQSQNADYMSQFSPEQLAYFYDFPGWFVALWAIAVWGGVLGAVCLLLRRAVAEKIFLASLVSATITTIYNYGLSDGLQVAGDTFSLVFTAIILVVALALYLYAKAMGKRGVLT